MIKNHFTRFYKFSSMQQLSKKKRQEPRTGTERVIPPQKSQVEPFQQSYQISTQSVSNLRNFRFTQAKGHKSLRRSWANHWFLKLYWIKSKYGIEKYQSFTLSTPKSRISQKPLKKVRQLIRIHATSITILIYNKLFKKKRHLPLSTKDHCIIEETLFNRFNQFSPQSTRSVKNPKI